MENDPKMKEVKIILLGDAGVGKTSIISRYYKNEFDINSMSTGSSSFITKTVQKNDNTYKLNIWDTSGQERYRSVTKIFVQGANIVILVYAIDVKETFDIINYWHKIVIDIVEGEENIILAVVGNKSDKFEEAVISEEDGQKLADEKKAIFKLVSAKDDPKGIFSLFDTLLDEYIKKNYNQNFKESSFKIKKPKKSKKDKTDKTDKNCC